MKAPKNKEQLKQLSLQDLVKHMICEYHDYSRKIMDEILELAEGDFLQSFSPFRDEFLFHFKKEEMILFPFITAVDKRVEDPEYVFSQQFPPSVTMPINMMLSEHESHHEAADTLLKLSAGLDVNQKMVEFHENIMEHMYIENEILFPGAASREKLLK